MADESFDSIYWAIAMNGSSHEEDELTDDSENEDRGAFGLLDSSLESSSSSDDEEEAAPAATAGKCFWPAKEKCIILM